MAAKGGNVLVATDRSQARHGVDAVVAVHLDQQMLAVGPYVGRGVAGKIGEAALQFSGVGLCERRGHAGRTSWVRQFAAQSRRTST